MSGLCLGAFGKTVHRRYGYGGAIIEWAGGGNGRMRPPTAQSMWCACLHRRADVAATKWAEDLRAATYARGRRLRVIKDFAPDENEAVEDGAC